MAGPEHSSVQLHGEAFLCLYVKSCCILNHIRKPEGHHGGNACRLRQKTELDIHYLLATLASAVGLGLALFASQNIS